MSRYLASLFVVALFSGHLGPAWSQQYRFVHTNEGHVFASINGGIASFRGIPYAMPSKEFDPKRQAPHAPAVRSEILAADHYSTCTCGAFAPENSEDTCLTANVFVPSERSEGKLAVLVWIGGGSAPKLRDYEVSGLTQEGIILVTFDYRSSVSGLPEMCSAAQPCLDFAWWLGIPDQLAALRWIRANIAEFGGDPDNVTIMGVGGESVAMLMLSEEASDLFNRAIINVTGPSAFGPIEDETAIRCISSDNVAFTDERARSLDRRGPNVRSGGKQQEALGPPSQLILDIIGRFAAGQERALSLMVQERHLGIPAADDGNKARPDSVAPQDLVLELPSILGTLHSRRGGMTFRYFLPDDERADGAQTEAGIAAIFAQSRRGLLANEQGRPSELVSKYLSNFVRSGNPNRDSLPYSPP